MKKIYITPQMEKAELESELMTTASKAINGLDGDLGYGGVDTEGIKDPSARYYENWYDELEEDW